ncbi:dihydroorotate dehydrogenase electron transfer subunit [bacterium]|nr:dihydroorotate dehydrogenase electron transfer subunit [bacterium]
MEKLYQVKAKILSNQKLTPLCYRIRLRAPQISKEAKPGQFIHCRCSPKKGRGQAPPLLRRPFSIHRTKDGTLDILYKVIGKGTQVLSRKKVGEYLDILGPLGNGYKINKRKRALLVAGGTGIASLVFLAQRLSSLNSKPRAVFIGAKRKEELLCVEDFKKLGYQVQVSTDDGSSGFKGLVTDLLKKQLSSRHSGRAKNPGSNSLICASGPGVMLKKVAQISKKYKISCQVSLEENMGCGIGACMGCVTKIKPQGYKRVCADGPVFNADEVTGWI